MTSLLFIMAPYYKVLPIFAVSSQSIQCIEADPFFILK